MYYAINILNYNDEILEFHKVNPKDIEHFFKITFERYGKRIDTEYIHFDIRPINFACHI